MQEAFEHVYNQSQQKEGAVSLKAFCFQHGRQCPVNHSHQRFLGKMKLLVAGITCIDWSVFGSQNGWLGVSCPVYVQFAVEALSGDYDIIIVECTSALDRSGFYMFEQMFEVHFISTCPSHVGLPIRRPRLYTVMLKKNAVVTHNIVSTLGFEKLFAIVFHRRTVLSGDDLFRAPDNIVNEYLSGIAMRKGYPARRNSGRPWQSFSLLTHSERARVKMVEALNKKRGRLVVNVRQKFPFCNPSTCLPALLRQTNLWSVRHKRLAVPLEHIEFKGYAVFSEPDSEEGQAAFAQYLLGQPSCAVRRAAGNAMHACSVGYIMMLVLALCKGSGGGD